MNNERDRNQTTQPGNPNRDQQNQGGQKSGQFDRDQQQGGHKPGQFDRDQQGQQSGQDRQQGGMNKDREANQK
jgi:hypothetical protein